MEPLSGTDRSELGWGRLWVSSKQRVSGLGGLQGGLSSVSPVTAPLAWGESGKFCLSGDGRFLPSVIDGDKKVAFPSDSRWCSENKSIFCNMVASACPKERFVVGPVPVWLSASEDGQVITECSRWLGGQRGRGLWKASCSRPYQE